MRHTDCTYRGWTIDLLTGFVDHHWSSAFTIQQSDNPAITSHSGSATGPTEEDALQNALTAAQRWVDNREAGTTL